MEMEDQAVTNFRDYIKIKSIQPNPDYAGCVKWLQEQAKTLGAKFQITECVPGKPIVILTLQGTDPSLPSVLLNSHTDVVPVFPEHWKYDPFSAHKDECGNIYGRGTQDMKCVGVQYIEAIKVLQKQNVKLKHTLHLSFVPDEEVGGVEGMGLFVKTNEFMNLDVGFVLDEGIASPNEDFFIFYAERNVWRMWFHCSGQPGHGSQFLPNTAGYKVQSVINSALDFRDAQEKKLKCDPSLSLGDVTTLNLTMINGGVQFNVVPSKLSVGFDIRLAPSVNFDEFETTLNEWAKEAGEGVTIEFVLKGTFAGKTCVDDGKSVWWDAFNSACKQHNLTLHKRVFPAATDSKYLRDLGIPAIGFSPMNNTPVLLHDHNEFLNEKVFLRGINIYTNIIQNLANI